MEGLSEAFAGAMGTRDRLWVLPVFDAGGTANRTVRSEELVGRLAGKGAAAEVWNGDLARLAAAVAGESRGGDSVLVMGARDPALPGLARRIAELSGGGKESA